MSNDIVKYLRLSRTRFNRHAEAADEIERLRADRNQWRNLAMKDHIEFCPLNDHELCVDYMEWRHGQEMREAGWQ